MIKLSSLGSMFLFVAVTTSALAACHSALEEEEIASAQGRIAATSPTIESFIECLNEHAADQDSPAAVACLPPGCKVTLTMSTESAQPACPTEGYTCQLPRVIFTCEGEGDPPTRFMPSFTLCPDAASEGYNRVEIMWDDGCSLEAADIEMNQGEYDLETVLVTDRSCATNGGNCHGETHGGTGTHDGSLFDPIEPAGEEPGNADAIIFTNVPGQEADPDGFDAESLSDICECIDNAIHNAAPDLNSSEANIVQDLCHALEQYVNSDCNGAACNDATTAASSGTGTGTGTGGAGAGGTGAGAGGAGTGEAGSGADGSGAGGAGAGGTGAGGTGAGGTGAGGTGAGAGGTGAGGTGAEAGGAPPIASSEIAKAI